MPDFVDFEQLKRQVSIEQCVQMLGLNMKRYGAQLRSACPQCRAGGDRALTVNLDRGVHYCFSLKKGGDQIALVAHVKGISAKQAALDIARHFGVESEPERTTAPSRPQEARREGLPELDYLDPIHEAVEALGISPVTADLLGAGYAPRGTMKGRTLLPMRLPDGTLIGYVGIGLDMDPPFLFPANLEERAENKVVPLRKKG